MNNSDIKEWNIYFNLFVININWFYSISANNSKLKFVWFYS